MLGRRQDASAEVLLSLVAAIAVIAAAQETSCGKGFLYRAVSRCEL